jgi:hypothetical protein
MTFPCLIWADPRTGSSALFKALSKVCDRPAFFEPFQFGPHPREWAHIYEDWCVDGDPAALYEAIGQRALIKHIPEAFDDNFNADLARAAEHHGYRHIHLVRCNTFARLLSRGIAEQLDAWDGPAEDIRSGDLNPLDVPHLISDLRLDAARWRAIVPHLTAVLTVRMEDVTNPNRARRHDYLSHILRFLCLPRIALRELDEELSRGHQKTSLIAPWVPNLDELRVALATEGAA